MLDRLFDLILQVLHLFKFWYVVEPFQRATCVSLGTMIREWGPGIHFKAPLNVDTIFEDNVVPRAISLKPQSLITADQKQVVITVVLTYAISDIQIFTMEVESADDVVTNCAYGFITDLVLRRTWEEISKPEFITELRRRIRQKAEKWGVHVVDVQLADLSPARSYRLWQSDQMTVVT